MISRSVSPRVNRAAVRVDGETATGYAEEWDLDRLWGALASLYPTGLTQEQVREIAQQSGVGIVLDEAAIPVDPQVAALIDAAFGPAREIVERVVAVQLEAVGRRGRHRRGSGWSSAGRSVRIRYAAAWPPARHRTRARLTAARPWACRRP